VLIHLRVEKEGTAVSLSCGMKEMERWRGRERNQREDCIAPVATGAGIIE